MDMVELSHILFEANFPGIFILLARAIIASSPERYLDIDYLIDVIQRARMELDLEEIDDPSLDYWDMVCEKVEQQELTEQQSAENIALKKQLKESDLLVNCTSAGMHPNVDISPLQKDFLHKDLVVFDTVYNPPQTNLLADARDLGCRYQNGLRMLLYQAYASFEYWTGVKIERDMLSIDDVQEHIGL